MNLNIDHLKQVVNEKTKAIVCVHYGGLPCEMDEIHALAAKYSIPVIEDAAHALGATYKGKRVGEISDFTMFSFQAIKHITTGDGGMVTIRDNSLVPAAKRIRWFGIDRTNKQNGIWENDITEIGYKYQMTDIAAAMGIAGMHTFENVLALRRQLFEAYSKGLKNMDGVKMIGDGYTDREHAAWLCTIHTDKRVGLMKHLRAHGIESGQVHYRNDRYSVLGGRRSDLPFMDQIEDNYLVLPLHTRMDVGDVDRICNVIRKGW
jgi:dTDP-4-amino-4,6-dideoxygalactose transaminase